MSKKLAQAETEIRFLKKENEKLHEKIKNLEILANKYKSGDIPNCSKSAIMQEKLSGRFSKPIIDVMSDPKRKRVQNPPESDLSFAMKIRRSSKIEALNLIRTVIPYPGLTKLQQTFGWIHVIPGFIKSVIAFYKLKVPQMKPLEELSAVCYDEINLSEQGSLDMRYDLYIKDAKEANMLFVRSLINPDLKMPFHLQYDSAYSKETFLEIIRTLQALGLKVLIQTCDQGTRNR